MTDKTDTKPKNAHGGARAGAGRPRHAPELARIDAPTSGTLQEQAAAFLHSVMLCSDVDMKLRIDAAKTLIRAAPPPGVRASAQTAAEAAMSGRFAPRHPPGGVKAARQAAAFDATGTAWDDLLPGPDDLPQ